MKWMKVVFRWFLYGWAGLSGLLTVGSLIPLAFMVDFTIENQTDETLLVTPIGTVGKEGGRHLLPVLMAGFIDFPARHASRFRLVPGESLSISYDMDDINVSEIVVENEQGEARQLVTDPTPTQNQYHGPARRSFAINDWNKLEPLSDAVKMVPLEPRPYQLVCRFLIFIIPPWMLLKVISRRQNSLKQSEVPSP